MVSCVHCGTRITGNIKKCYCSKRCYYNRNYKKLNLPTKICLKCNKEYKPRQNKQMFCTSKCKRSKIERIQKDCVVCGNSFTTHIAHKSTCSQECRKEHKNNKYFTLYRANSRILSKKERMEFIIADRRISQNSNDFAWEGAD